MSNNLFLIENIDVRICDGPGCTTPLEPHLKRYCSRDCFNRDGASRRKAISEGRLRGLRDNPEMAKRLAEASSERLKRTRSRGLAETLNKLSSDRMKKLNSDPEFAARRDARFIATVRELEKDPEFLARRNRRASEALIKLHKTPEFIERRSEWLAEANRHRSKCTSSQLKLFDRLPVLGKVLEHIVLFGSMTELVNGLKTSCRIDIAHLPTKTAIEVDGGYHLKDDVKAYDKVKDVGLTYLHWAVVRCTNKEIDKDLDATVSRVMTVVNSRPIVDPSFLLPR